MLRDEAQVECHVCLTPTWSETAWFADYVLPMGHASERHDLLSQETHAARWIGFRQPVLRVALEKQGERFATTLCAAGSSNINLWLDSGGALQYIASLARPSLRKCGRRKLIS